MTVQKTTVRVSEHLAARLRRAAYLGKCSQNDVITEALEHWLVNPRKPGCGLRRAADAVGMGDAADALERAAP